MKKLLNLRTVSIFTFCVIALLVLTINACNKKVKEDLSKIPVNQKFEQAPPATGDITITEVKDNAEGNILVVADFGKSLGKEQFHAVMLGDDKVVLRDDGKNGDDKAGDGKFSVLLKEDLTELQNQLSTSAKLLKEQKDFITFSGRNLVHIPLNQLDFRGLENFRERKSLIIPRFFLPCAAPPVVIKENSLMITAKAVVEDTGRTFNPCNKAGNPNGVWAFPRLVSEMANSGSTGISPSDFLKKWLESWLNDVTVNADVIAKRIQINSIINTWSNASGGSFDIKFAPFKLIAIVNRVDLRGNSGYGFSNPGEGRFVFCAVNCNDNALSVLRNPAPFMVIFEYGIPKKSCAQLKAFAKEWVDLSAMTLGTVTYNNALEKITNQFTMANTSPSKPNGSSINQIRTNELAIGAPWELREFNVDSATHLLKNVTVKQEPQVRFNKQQPAQVPADVAIMANFVNTNTANVEANTYTIEAIEAGKPFLAGKAHTLNPSTYHWNGSTAAGPEFITSDSARFILSLNTCSGCHGGEANTGNFMHVAPAGITGTPALLSGFLKGNPPLSSGGFVVTDRANRPVPPGKAREFNDLERRKLDLEKLVSCPCARKVKTLELIEILRMKPINMTH
jgi:hypothetical protein